MCTGITWLLSDLVVHMKPATWATQYEALAFTALPPARATVPPTAALREWLSHQKGLFLLGGCCTPACLFDSHGGDFPRIASVMNVPLCSVSITWP